MNTTPPTSPGESQVKTKAKGFAVDLLKDLLGF